MKAQRNDRSAEHLPRFGEIQFHFFPNAYAKNLGPWYLLMTGRQGKAPCKPNPIPIIVKQRDNSVLSLWWIFRAISVYVKTDLYTVQTDQPAPSSHPAHQLWPNTTDVWRAL
jgi:hypothetical protein